MCVCVQTCIHPCCRGFIIFNTQKVGIGHLRPNLPIDLLQPLLHDAGSLLHLHLTSDVHCKSPKKLRTSYFSTTSSSSSSSIDVDI